MNAVELRAKNDKELGDLLIELRKEQFNLRMAHGTGTLDGPHQMRKVRRDIARLKTVLNERQGKTA
jgi:large subunit ribosomal protein L29